MSERPRLAERAARAERALLAALLHNPADLGEAAALLTADDFAQHAHALVWRAVVALWDAGLPVELASVGQELLRRGAVADLGGWGWLADLYAEGSPGQQVGHYAGEVADLALLRRLAAAGHEVARLAEEPAADAREALGRAEALLFGLGQGRRADAVRGLAGLLDEEAGRLDRLTALPPGERAGGVPTGLGGLDALTGGWQPGALAVVAARPSVGKTALAVAFARAAAAGGRAVLVCSLEQSAAELTRRLLAALARVDGQRLERGELSGEECGRVLAAARAAAGWRLAVDDSPRASVLQVAAVARRLRARGELDLLLLDYLQLVDPEDRRAPRHEQVAAVSRRLKALARELSVPLVALAQLNRGVEDRGPQARPRLADLRESGGIEADADQVLLLHRPAGREHLLELHLAKARNGPTGELTVEFDRATMTFYEAGVF